MVDQGRRTFMPVDVAMDNGHLALLVRHDNTPSSWQSDWANAIIRQYPDGVHTLSIDLRHYLKPCSSFFSGAIRLLEYYRDQGLDQIRLRNVSDRTRVVMELLSVDTLFTIES